MKPIIHQLTPLVRHRAAVQILVLLLAGAMNSAAHDEWFRGLDLEPALSDASLVLVARVVERNQDHDGRQVRERPAPIQIRANTGA